MPFDLITNGTVKQLQKTGREFFTEKNEKAQPVRESMLTILADIQKGDRKNENEENYTFK